MSLALGALVWGASFILGLGGEGLQLQKYLALLAFYAASSAVFVMSRIRRGKLQLFEIPVYITVMSFLQFGLAPLRNFVDPTQLAAKLSANGEELVRALSYYILGMIAFWIACMFPRRTRGDQMFSGLGPQKILLGSRNVGMPLILVVLYAVSFGTRFYLLQNRLYSYVGSLEKYYENLASMQVLNVLSQLGTLALIIVTIERFCESYELRWRMLFAVVLSSEVFWGLISGMKGLVFGNFIVVALVSSFVQRRLNLRWLVVPFFALVLLYPVSEAYRSLVRGGGVEVTSFEGAARAGHMAFTEAGKYDSNPAGMWGDRLGRLVTRFDLLTSVAQVLTLGPRASMVKGDAHWWMLPFYPFVPRLIWPSKPILDEGTRFSVALGSPRTTSTAVTYPGDLYLQFGLLGIPVGMFALGIIAQWFTNSVSGLIERPNLFVYAGVSFLGFPLESDVFSVCASLIKILAILYVLRWLIYGPRSQRQRTTPASRLLVPVQLFRTNSCEPPGRGLKNGTKTTRRPIKLERH